MSISEILINLAKNQARKSGLFATGDISSEKRKFLDALRIGPPTQEALQTAIGQCSDIQNKAWLEDLKNIVSDSPDFTKKLNPFVQPFQEHLLLEKFMQARSAEESEKAAAAFAQYCIHNLAGKTIDIEKISQLFKRHSDITGLNAKDGKAKRIQLYAQVTQLARSSTPEITVMDSNLTKKDRMPEISAHTVEPSPKPIKRPPAELPQAPVDAREMENTTNIKNMLETLKQGDSLQILYGVSQDEIHVLRTSENAYQLTFGNDMQSANFGQTLKSIMAVIKNSGITFYKTEKQNPPEQDPASQKTSSLKREFADPPEDDPANIYGNAQQIFQTQKNLPALKKESPIKVLGAGNYGIVVEVQLATNDPSGNPIKRARKIEIDHAESLAQGLAEDQRNALLHAFFDGKLSYQNLQTILTPPQAGQSDLRQIPVTQLLANLKNYGLQENTPSQSETKATNFSKEYQTLALLGGTYFPEVHGYDAALNTYDMAIAEKGSLKSALDSPTTSPIEKMALLEGLSKAVAFVISHNMIHNDLHAGNILVGKGFNVVIADPGKVRFTGHGDSTVAFKRDPRQNYLMHPDFLMQLSDANAKHSDTIYNDTWSYVLLIGKILDKNIAYITSNLESYGPVQAMKDNLELVNQAIRNSQLSREAKALLSEKIKILAPEHIPADTTPYEHRGTLIQAMQAIQDIIQEERVSLEAKAKSIVIGASGTLSTQDLEKQFPQINLLSDASLKGFVEEIFKLAQKDNKKIDATILQAFLNTKLSKNPEKVAKILEALRDPTKDAAWLIAQPAAASAQQLATPPSLITSSFKHYQNLAQLTEQRPAAQAVLSLDEIFEAIKNIEWKQGFSANCASAISAKAEARDAKIDRDILIQALQQKDKKAPAKVDDIVAKLNKSLMMQAPARSASLKGKP